MHRLVRSAGFEAVAGKGGHMKLKYRKTGEILKGDDGSDLIMCRKASGDLSYGTVISLLDELIAFLERNELKKEEK